MARLYRICALSIILLLIVQETVSAKAKKEFKKGKGKHDGFVEEAKSRYSKHSSNEQYRRPVRSLKEPKFKEALEEAPEEKPQPQYIQGNRQKIIKIRRDNIEEAIGSPKKSENTCSKKSECSIGQKRRKNSYYVMVEEPLASSQERVKTKRLFKRVEDSEMAPQNGKKRKLNIQKQLYLEGDGADTEKEPAPETVQYKVASKSQKEKKLPTFLIVEESESDEANESENQYLGKGSKYGGARMVIDRADEMELENVTGHHYLLEEEVDEPSFDFTGNEEEYEEDFL